MLASVKSTVRRTKKFVKEHKTLSACAVTAVVTFKLAHDLSEKKSIAAFGDVVYELGKTAGKRELELLTFYEFLDANGEELTKAYEDFALTPR